MHSKPNSLTPTGETVDMSPFEPILNFEKTEVQQSITEFCRKVTEWSDTLKATLAKRGTEFTPRKALDECKSIPGTVYWNPDVLACTFSSEENGMKALVTSPEDRHALLAAQNSFTQIIHIAAAATGKGLQTPAQHVVEKIKNLYETLQIILQTSPNAPVPPWSSLLSVLGDAFHYVAKFTDPEQPIREFNVSMTKDLANTEEIANVPFQSVSEAESRLQQIVHTSAVSYSSCLTKCDWYEEQLTIIRPILSTYFAERELKVSTEIERLNQFLSFACNETINVKDIQIAVSESQEHHVKTTSRIESDINKYLVDLQRIDSKQRSAVARISDAVSEIRKLQLDRQSAYKRLQDLNANLIQEKEKMKQFEESAKNVLEWAKVLETHRNAYRQVVADTEKLSKFVLESARGHITYVHTAFHYGHLRTLQQSSSYLKNQFVSLGHLITLKQENLAALNVVNQKWQAQFLLGQKVKQAQDDYDATVSERQRVRDTYVALASKLNAFEMKAALIDECDRSAAVLAQRHELCEIFREEQAARKQVHSAANMPVDTGKETELTRNLIAEKMRKTTIVNVLSPNSF